METSFRCAQQVRLCTCKQNAALTSFFEIGSPNPVPSIRTARPVRAWPAWSHNKSINTCTTSTQRISTKQLAYVPNSVMIRAQSSSFTPHLHQSYQRTQSLFIMHSSVLIFSTKTTLATLDTYPVSDTLTWRHKRRPSDITIH